MFPSILNIFNRPSATDRLDSPSHSALHNTVSSAVGQIEAVIGVEGANSVVGTLEYFIKSPDSNGGGHVQTANKGGTGQTTFSKGDILVASSSSVLSKLAVGGNGTQLVADSAAAAGIKWASIAGSKVVINIGTASIYNTSNEQVLFASSIIGSTLGVNNGIKFVGTLENYSNAGTAFTLRFKYGGDTIGNTIIVGAPSNPIVQASGAIEGYLVANNSSVQQKAYANFYANISNSETDNDTNVGISKALGAAVGTSSINSSGDKNLVITGQFAAGGTANSILTSFLVVEKIQ